MEPLSERELVLKEYLYYLINKDRRSYLRLPRRPDNKVIREKIHLIGDVKSSLQRILEDEVILAVLSDRILGIDEFKLFVERMTELLSTISDIRAHEVAIHLAMDLLGLGPIGFLLLDDEVEEVMVNGPEEVFVYKNGRHQRVEQKLFYGVFDIYELIDQLATIHQKEVTVDSPFLTASLPDGSRIQATVPPVTPHSPTLTVRKYKKKKLSIFDLIRFDTLTTEAAAYLWLAVEGLGINPLNILVIGGTATGKTTFLNALLAFIPENNRIITIEDVREIYVPHQNKVNMVSFGRVSLDDLLVASLRMRPDRLVVGEVRGKEAVTLFQAMNVGHRGTMGTLHANSAREAVQRLTHSPMNVPPDMLPLIDLIVVLKRFPDGKRKVVEIVETERGETALGVNPLFIYKNGALQRVGSYGRKLEVIADQASTDVKTLMEEVKSRKMFLDRLLDQSVSFQTSFKLFSRYIQSKTVL